MTFTAEELKNHLWDTETWDEFVETLEEESSFNVPGFGTATFVDQTVERTGDGNPQFLAFKIDDRLFALSGWFDSWAGGEFDGDIFEAERYEIVTHSYRPKKV